MKAAVRYYSRGGNTKKLAEAVSKAIDVPAKTTSEPLTEDVDVLFLGSSVYAYGVDDNVKEFIKNINVKVGKVVNFSTAAIVKSTYNQVKKLLDEKGITMAKEEFYCKGSFGPLHRGKPNEKDLKEVTDFAKRYVKKNKKVGI
ncbi:MAG: flavodoxin [Clostridia bacterium]|nr:flavodoxin [Clostridia bacterium]